MIMRVVASSLPVLSSHWPRAVSVLIIAELDRGAGEAENLISNQLSALAGIWTPDHSIDSPAR